MQTNKFTSNINLGLRYDCIYYFPSRTDKLLNEMMNEAVDRWKCKGEIWDTVFLMPEYKFQVVPEELMSKLYEEAAPDATEKEYTRELLQKMMGSEDGGVLVARLYSGNKDEPAELLVCSDIEPGFSSEIDELLNNLASKAAYNCFERVTGVSYRIYKEQFDNEKYGGGRSIDAILSVGDFRKRRTSSLKSPESILSKLIDLQNIIKEAGKKEEVRRRLSDMVTEIDDDYKLKRRSQIVVDYDDKDCLEIFVQRGDDRIRCEFERAKLGKVYYIFFLRHPQGIRLSELPKYRKELTEIYRKFVCHSEEEVLVNIKNYEKTGIQAQFRTAVRSFFNEIFGSALVPDYVVDKNKKDSYSIPLDRKYVDLGEFRPKE